MNDTRSKQLTEKQQILLSAYVDNECSFVSRFFAERLLKTNVDARLFVQNLADATKAYTSLAVSHDPSVNLWDRISHRIEGEERAAIYLGQRKPITEPVSPSLLERLLSRHALVGGLSGAAIAATVLVLVTRPSKPGEILPVYTGGPVAAHNSSAFHQASLGSEQPKVGSRSAMEVDWMRGNGSFKIIQHPKDNSAIIWVRKRSTQPSARNQRVNPTPTIRVMDEQGLDVTPLGAAK